MALYFRVLRYLAPAASQIALAVLVSFLTSLFSVFSIYTILPLLDTIFSNRPAARADSASTPVQALPDSANGMNSPAKPDVKSVGTFNDLTRQAGEALSSGLRMLLAADSREQMLFNICLFVIIVFVLKNFFVYLNKQLVGRIESKTAKKLRDEIFSKLLSLSLDFYHRHRVGTLMDYVQNQVNIVHSTIGSGFMNFVLNPLLVIFFLACMMYVSWKLTLFAFAVSMLSLFSIRFVGKSVRQEADKLQEKVGDMNALLQEVFSGIKVVKSSAMEQYESARFHGFTDFTRRSQLNINAIRDITSPLNETLAVAAIACVLWFGGLQVFAGAMTQSELLFFVFALFSIMNPIKTMAETNTRIQEGLGAATRLFTLLDTAPSVQSGSRTLTGLSDAIRFEDVWFRYEERYVLKGVSFELKKGEMTALVGQSGSGKSTLVDLILRFYDAERGRITIDGIDIREFETGSLRKLFGVVSQEVVLFNDTIANNIAYGVRGIATEDAIRQAARVANAAEFIDRSPQQYDTFIGDRGVRLSGGQRQRLSIARAMLKNPPVLIFDEATSALDNESEKVVQAAIETAMTDRTSIVIAHRLSTIQNADKIIVLNDGELKEIGTHHALLSADGFYKRLYDMQFSKTMPETAGIKP